MFEKIQLGDEVVLYARESDESVADVWDGHYTIMSHPNRITAKVYGKAGNIRSGKDQDMILVSLPLEWASFRKTWDSYAKHYKAGQYLPGVEDIHCYEIYDDRCVVHHIPKATPYGMTCSDCGDSYHMAVPNCGNLLICWSCRNSKPRKYSMVNGQVIINK